MAGKGYISFREYAKFNDREYAEVQTELAAAWSQLMMMLDEKESRQPFRFHPNGAQRDDQMS